MFSDDSISWDYCPSSSLILSLFLAVAIYSGICVVRRREFWWQSVIREEEIVVDGVKVYSRWKNPNTPIMEVFVETILSFYGDTSGLSVLDPACGNETTRKSIEAIQSKIIRPTSWTKYQKIAKLMGCKNVTLVKVPIQYDILSTLCGIKDGFEDSKNYSQKTVDIYMHHFAKDLIELDNAENVPIIIWFHPGAFVLGSGKDLSAVQLYNSLRGKMNKLSFIVASVDMRLAPDFPFPIPLIDCFSATKYIIDKFSSNPVHIAGHSAGGNLASVVAFEFHRAYPGRIRSVFLREPYLDPSCATKSYVSNFNSSRMANVPFLKWGWRAYLQENNETLNDVNGPTLDQNIDKETCKWFKNNLWRLVAPQLYIPSNLGSGCDDNESPKFIIVTCRGDPLRDEGLTFVDTLKKAGADVLHISSGGSHGLGLYFDTEARNQLIEEYTKTLMHC